MGKIITLKDRVTQENTYPITSIDAVIMEDGQKFSDKMKLFLEEATITLENTVALAQAAEDSITELTNLNNTGNFQEEIDSLLITILENKQKLVTLEQDYRKIKLNLTNLLTKSDTTNNINKEPNKIPTGVAVRNHISDSVLGIVESLVNITETVPTHTTSIGQILVNENTNEVFISSPHGTKWLKFNTVPIYLESVKVDASITNNTIELTGNLDIKDSTIILNAKKVENDTLIL